MYLILVLYMEILGLQIPLYVIFLIGIVAVFIVWKLIKFAIKILLVIVVFFLILFGLDVMGVFDFAQNLITSVI